MTRTCTAAACCWAALAVGGLHGQTKPELTEAPELVGPNDWRVSWESVPGAIYRLERSLDLENWAPVDLLQAADTNSELVDAETPQAEKVFWRVVWVGNSGNLTPKMLGPVEPLPDNEWRITWTSVPGLRYVLERSFDLELWEEVETVDAVADLTSLIDAQVAAGQPRAFWRVGLLGVPPDGGSVVLSDVEVTTRKTAEGATLTYSVLAGGSATIGQVVFFDGDVELGEARRGLGDLWSITLPWNPGEFTPRSIRAEATDSDGNRTRSEPSDFLAADPSRFVPLAADGTPRFGSFLPLESDGSLPRFLFYPEGQSAAAETAGVHFEIAAGARLAAGAGGPAELVFSSALYFNGHSDDEPDALSGNDLRIEIDAVTPSAIAGLSPALAVPLPLRWGSVNVEWSEGVLAPDGWKSLTVRPPIGSFPLPREQTTGRVVAGPQESDEALVVCYHGEWRPAGDDALLFRIPASDPLKIYLYRSGRIDAQGSAEAEFENGGTVRGRFSWRAPVFEFHFAGRALTIPALGSLDAVLPANPADCLTGAATDAELDAAAECLRAFRIAYHGLTLGSLAHGADNTGPVLPATDPGEEALAALAAWTARAESWEADRSGESLSEQQAREVVAIATAAATASAAGNDLTIALRTVRLLLALSEAFPLMASGSGVPASELDPAVDHAVAGFERILRDSAVIGFDGTLGALNRELAKMDPPPDDPANPAGPGGPPPDDPVRSKKLYDLLPQVLSKFNNSMWARFGIDDIVLTEPNPFLNSPEITDDDLFAFYAANLELFEFWLHQGLATSFDDAPVPGVDPNVPAHMNIRRSLELLRDPLLFAHQRRVASGRSVDHLVARIDERRDLVATYQQLELVPGTNVFESSLDPSTPDLLAQLETALRLVVGPGKLAGAEPRALIRKVSESVDALGELSEDPATQAYLATKWYQLSLVNNFVPDAPNQAFADFFCLDLESRLGAGGGVEPHAQGDEGEQGVPLTGRYDARLGDSLYTLQVNQGGRYIVGWLTEYRATNPSQRAPHESLLEGLLREDFGPFGSLGAAYTIRVADTRSADFSSELLGTLEVFNPPPGEPDVLLHVAGLNAGKPLAFRRVSQRPRWPDEVLDSLPPEGDSLRDSHRFPLHEAQVAGTIERAFRVASLLEDHLALFTVRDELSLLVSELSQLELSVHPEQVGQNRELFINTLGSLAFAEPQEIPDEFQRLDPWEALRVVIDDARGSPLSSGTVAAFDGFAEGLPEEEISPQRFEYVIEGVMGGAGAFLPGGAIFDFTLIKREFSQEGAPPGAELQRQRFWAFLGGLSVGAGGFVAGVTVTGNTVSKVDYDLPTDFADARLHFFSVGGSLSLGEGRAYSPYAKVTIEGDNREAKFDVSGFSEVLGLALSAGFDWWTTGQLSLGTDSDPVPVDLPPIFGPATYAGSVTVRAGQPVHFATEESEVTRCGNHLLREFVANFRAFIASPLSVTRVDAYADSTGHPDFNQRLSDMRAANTREALLAILHGATAAGTVVATGFGETAAAAAIGVDPLNDPGRPQPEFRRADVIIDGRFSVQLFAPEVSK